jgi:hypothetical protein
MKRRAPSIVCPRRTFSNAEKTPTAVDLLLRSVLDQEQVQVSGYGNAFPSGCLLFMK